MSLFFQLSTILAMHCMQLLIILQFLGAAADVFVVDFCDGAQSPIFC
jgi:hypothetical protein